MGLRIISGALRGRRIGTARGGRIRPTSDRLRETIFNIIRDQVTGRNVLDLFAGTGALGIEALSRGAASAVFIDNSATAIRDQIMDFARLSAEELRAQGDMAAAEYAQVFNQDEDFAIFLRKLETYRQMLSNRATVILPVDVLLHPGRGLLEREPAQDSE